MAASSSSSQHGAPPSPGFIKGTFALSQDEGSSHLAPRGSTALTQLLRSRSHGSLPKYSGSWPRPDDEESALLAGSEPDEDGYQRRAQVDERRLSQMLMAPPMRSMRLIGNSNPRYRWAKYWKSEAELKAMPNKRLRHYYERTNYLVQQYLYIDRLLDSSLPHDLLNEYNTLPASHFRGVEVPDTIAEEPPSDDYLGGAAAAAAGGEGGDAVSSSSNPKKVKRTPKDIYRATETTPLFNNEDDDGDEDDHHHDHDDECGRDANGNTTPCTRRSDGGGGGGGGARGSSKPEIPWLQEDDDLDSGDRIVTLAIYVNFAANVILLAGKVGVVASVSSMSVIASLVDAVLDFLSTLIVWTTTWLISRQDQYKYPVGRRRLEPLGVLVFSVIMITSFAQVALESIQRLVSSNHDVVEIGIPALLTMIGTIVIKGLCWLWCRLVKNSSVQALASDALTDVIFNTGSILFPIIGFYAGVWWLDPLGGLLLSLVVIYNWSDTTLSHIKNLSGFSASADQRNVLLYLTMRFAKTIKQIQGLQAYHSGDKLNVEVDIILDASTTLRDSHDVAESLGYVLESVPIVDRAFVHADYATWNLPTHMEQQSG